ncbi:MAG TPA: AraD1 family protein [Variovorax sp.]|nr:AraD1 family protein [Variovorax sp.]
MRLVQFEAARSRRQVGVVEGASVLAVNGVTTMHGLGTLAIQEGRSLQEQVLALGTGAAHDYEALLSGLRVLAPLDHADPAHLLVSGTGLTHVGSAATRDKMHQKAQPAQDGFTDSMRMFKWGVAGGRPSAGEPGVQSEWFYKGDGSIVVRPGQALPVPPFAQDAGEEPEIAGLYLVGPDGKPYRLGFAQGNEFSDHVMERRSYLYLAHSKLRHCSFGPELRTGPLPAHLSGISRIRREGRVIWEREFLSGEKNMCHTLENLEYHHFKYAQFLRPGDAHVHFFGTATLSFADGLGTQAGDAFEISVPGFGAPLINPTEFRESALPPGAVVSL